MELHGINTGKEINPTYALAHLATFKVKYESEIRNPKEKLKVLRELDGSGAIWPQNMYLSFRGHWLLVLDNDMNEIENFPGSLVTEPTAFKSEDPLETFNNILVFTVPGVLLGKTEMHFFQVTNVPAVSLVEDLKLLHSGNVVTIDRNSRPLKAAKSENTPHAILQECKISLASDSVPIEKSDFSIENDAHAIQVLNHCFEDIERFVARLLYVGEALRELKLRQNQHSSHGEGLLILRSCPPTVSEFHDILAKLKLAINYVVRLHTFFTNASEPISHLFISLHTIVNVCNDVHAGAQIPEKVINPLLLHGTIKFLSGCLNATDIDLWMSLGKNWTMAKEHFENKNGSYHPIFYDDWSPDWSVDKEMPYIPLPQTKSNESRQTAKSDVVWLTRLQSRNVKIAKAIYNGKANNDRELNVVEGEYFEVIDDSRKWWKARNSAGKVGYVSCTVLEPYNFEVHSKCSTEDTNSIGTHAAENETFNAIVRPHSMKSVESALSITGKFMPRSYSMPNVPIPPPMPSPEKHQPTPVKRNMDDAGNQSAIRSRNDNENNDELLILQGTINEELRAALYQRERRKDLEILTTPNIYITQHSSPKEVEEWLRAKGFSDVIIAKLRKLNGEALFTLSSYVIEGYFGQQESRRLISQIVLQKNICEYKTIRSSELSAKLAKARQKADQQGYNTTEKF